MRILVPAPCRYWRYLSVLIVFSYVCFWVFLFVFHFYRNETTKFQALIFSVGRKSGRCHLSSVTTYQSPKEAVPIGPKPSNCSTSMWLGPAVSNAIVGAGFISC